MKPPIKLHYMEQLAFQLPPVQFTSLNCLVLLAKLWQAIATDSCLVLDWKMSAHNQFNNMLKANLSIPVYQFCRGHMRFDGAPPAALQPKV